MFDKIYFSTPDKADFSEGNLIINILSKKEDPHLDDPHINIHFILADFSLSPSELCEHQSPFSWNPHGEYLKGKLKELSTTPWKSLQVISKDATIEAAGLALAISESSICKGVHTQSIINMCAPEIDDRPLIEYKGYAPEIFKYAKSTYPDRAKKMTRYELMASLSSREVYELIFNKLPKRKIPINYDNLL